MTPRGIMKYSGKKYWFNCDVCKNLFEMRLISITGEKSTWCPTCKNKTEKKFLKWFTNKYNYNIIHQSKYDWCKNDKTNKYLPFDFAIDELKLIIEIDGEQHFKQVAKWTSPEKIFERDIYKMKKAKDNNYSIIRIYQYDIYKNINSWKTKFNKIIKHYEKPTVICIGCDKLYEKYYISF